MDPHDAWDAAAGSPPDPHRRATLAKLGIGAAAAWAAPTILSAPAASAATAAPCGTCDEEFVVNGDAESGTTAGWVSTAAGNGATFQSVLWTDIAGQFIQPAGSGLRAFYVEASTSTTTSATLVQRVEVPGCVGAAFWFDAAFGAAGNALAQVEADASVQVSFLDSNDDPLFGDIEYVAASGLSVPASVSNPSSVRILPVGTVAFRVTLRFDLIVPPQAQGTGAVVFDGISFRLLCS